MNQRNDTLHRIDRNLEYMARINGKPNRTWFIPAIILGFPLAMFVFLTFLAEIASVITKGLR